VLLLIVLTGEKYLNFWLVVYPPGQLERVLVIVLKELHIHILFLHTPQTINMIQLLQTFSLLSPKWVYQVVLVVRKLSANAGDLRDTSSIPGSGRPPGGGHGNPLQYSWASLVTQLVKNLPAIQETWVQTLDQEDPLEK